MVKLIIAIGTRPEIIKVTPIIKALKNKIDFKLVHTGQHYDDNLFSNFIDELGLQKPDYNLNIKATSPAKQTGSIIIGFEKVIRKEKPILILVQGDTNTVLATAISGNKLGINIGHIEAGLRSYDLRMPEEYNRRLVDHLSHLLFAPTNWARDNLLKENIWGKIFVTGNTVIDACIQNMPFAEKYSKITERIGEDPYLLATLHRAESVDNYDILVNLVEAFIDIPEKIVFPVHPRTIKMLQKYHLLTKLKSAKNVLILPPEGYFDFLLLMKNCKVILTDSGGIQEEATAPSIRKRVLVLRDTTERPEAVEAGFTKVIGTDKNNIVNAVKKSIGEEKKLPEISPYGNGSSGKIIVDLIIDEIKKFE